MLKSAARYRFGDKFRVVRERKGYTLKEVAARAGVSESMVSQIERNRVSPSVDTLIAIADALDVDPEYLFHEPDRARDVRIVRRSERAGIVLGEVVYHMAASIDQDDGVSPFEILFLQVPPGKEKGRIEYGHGGLETGIITEGAGEFIYGTEVYRLEAGDSISFRSDIPHVLKNPGDSHLCAVWAFSPPRIFKETAGI